MELEPRILALIAVGASVSANCQPCLERNARTALHCGADRQQISQAIDIGRRVRRGAVAKMDDFASRSGDLSRVTVGPSTADCDCSS
jgi:AhpD family alkylhydroperoxidase